MLKPFLKQLRTAALRVENFFDHRYLAPDVPMASIVSHQKWMPYLVDAGNRPGMRVLEVGSREVTGKSSALKIFNRATYVGFDYYAGTNVDVVRDAHKLSTYFAPDEKFDIIYTSACFEHFAMPWIVAAEMSKLLKVGASSSSKPTSPTTRMSCLGTFSIQ